MGALGSMCVRDCVRSSHEVADDDLPVGTAFSSSGEPGLGQRLRAPLVPVGNPAASDGPSAGIVPPVPNWSQVLADGDTSRGGSRRRGDVPKETPRFDEMRASPRPGSEATPRDAVGGEFRTPRPTPRDAQPGESSEISYEGMYLGAMKHGQGRLRMTSSTYDGEFQNDMKHGLGMLTWDDGRQYRGGFQQDKFHGHAVMTWPDGRQYIGNYSDDRKHGEGTFSWQDGRRYAGQWIHGKRHGVGVYTNAKGLTRRGTWQLDRPIAWELLGPADLQEPDAAAIAAAVDIAQSHVSGATALDSPRVEVVAVAQASPRDRRPGVVPEGDEELDLQVKVSQALPRERRLDEPAAPAKEDQVDMLVRLSRV